MKKKNSRKRQAPFAVTALALVCLALAIGLVAALFALRGKQKLLDEVIRQNALLMEEVNQASKGREGSRGEGEEETAEGSEEFPGQDKEITPEEGRKEPGDPGMEGAGEDETAGTETTEEETAAPPCLESLSGLDPGTVISAEQIDFSDLGKYFMSWEIEEGDNLYQRINGKSYRDNPYVPLSTLRYVKLPHYNFDGEIQVGELVVNQDILQDVKDIFMELFQAKYQIQSMYLIDNYWTGDPDTTDTASIDVNNTSAFCYREITGGGRLSNHAYGRAIDLNPQQNPYVSYSTGQPRWSHSNADAYIDRDTGLPHVITHEDLAYKLFKEHGFSWGGDWNNPKDYQHFDKNNR